MRITDPQVIKNGEKDLIASVQRDLDLDAVRDLLKDRLAATVLSPKGGQIVVHDNDVAFRLDYEINLNGSLLFNRNGDLIEVTDGKSFEQEEKGESGLDEIEDLENEPAFDQDDLDLLKSDDDELIDGLPQDNDVKNINNDEIPDIVFNDDDEDKDKDTSQDIGDDDISSILQESRDFWEKKKE